MEIPDLSRLANTLKRAEFGMTDKVYIGLDDVVTDKIGQIWPATFINSRDRAVTYHHSRIVEALKAELKIQDEANDILTRQNEELKAAVTMLEQKLRDVNKAHDRAEAKLDKAKWQPIESAPHDIKVLLAHFDSYKDEWVIEADYASQGRVGQRSFHSFATHWMPLPDAPEQR